MPDLHGQSIEGVDYRSGRMIRVHIAEGKITQIDSMADVVTGNSPTNPQYPWIAPGLTDLQINGFFGMDLNTYPIVEGAVGEITRKLWREGVTTWYPTVITNGDEQIEAMVRAIAAACAEDRQAGACIPGIHLEGPFISPEDGARGAHGKAFVKAPDWELFCRWQEAADGRIKLVTLSPEWPGTADFIRRCTASGVTVSIGHTAATPEQIREAVASGATMSTHLGNGSHLMLPRHPNYLWEQLASDELWPCAIADGFHLPASVLKVFLAVKPKQLMLVSDAVYLSGLVPGTYDTHIGGQVVLTPEGKLHLADNPRILAGSAQMLAFGMENLVRSGLCSRELAWEMASVRPASFMKLACGRGLEVGAPADLVGFTWEADRIAISGVWKCGEKVV
ncbi:MAG: N-acetylglucosamine-6-phosphate deacetylase [Paenibacillaceae bacterium]|jgi:N-acetylglucosamine-6-phosphate deacetylase|nr:N-acetylglucosamine-6-phosphate deacetylase [Paenibacillaceae bacterium]